ncbi:MAG TPA: hypothetical protein VJV05_01570 [Pyrinomonadaceae bacterium]|nr:hypothetical protein [Pyrinomonadaceae bacterium]
MLRNILAVIAGIVVGSIVNMGLINVGHAVIGLPPGADVSTMEGVAAAMQMFEAKHWVVPFVAHAGGTLVGALVATLIAATHKLRIAIAIGVLFLIGGITAGIMIKSPMWYNAIDFIFAYIPMAWIGAKLGGAGR